MRSLLIVFFLSYLLVIAYFALSPLQLIPGFCYERVPLEYEDCAVHIRKGAGLEDRGNVSRMRRVLVESGQMSLLVDLRTDSLGQRGWIVGSACYIMSLNFALEQDGNGVSFTVQTTSHEGEDSRSELLVPLVLKSDQWQQLVASYDGSLMRLYVDGQLCAECAAVGNLSGWGRDRALTIGAEAPGWLPWNGLIRRIAIFDQALDAEQILKLRDGQSVPGAVIDHDLGTMADPEFVSGNGLERLRYRNLFLCADVIPFPLKDFVLNIVGFVPLGFFVHILLPLWVRRRKFFSLILLPLLAGLVVSGSIEWAQCYMRFRTPSALDLATNVAGTLIGGFSAWFVMRVFQHGFARIKR